VVVFDRDLRVILAEGSLGRGTARGAWLSDAVPPALRPARTALWEAALQGARGSYETEIDGKTERVSVVPVCDEDGTAFAGMLVAHDITDEKRRTEELEARSVTDELTGLYNRRGFLELAEQHARVALRNRHPFAIMYCDLNGLKSINDALGHEVGDEALRQAARILKRVMRDADIVARLGGDEFVVLLDGCTTETIHMIVSRLRDELGIACFIDECGYRVSLSSGTAYFDPAQPQTIEELMAAADRRMYTSKRERPSINVPVVVPPASDTFEVAPTVAAEKPVHAAAKKSSKGT
jgi:diguanylate cyclase (GGDEF)-like protein